MPEARAVPWDANGNGIENSAAVVPSPPSPAADSSGSAATGKTSPMGSASPVPEVSNVRSLIERALGRGEAFSKAVVEMGGSGDPGFVPVLVDLLRFRSSREESSTLAAALVKLTQIAEPANFQRQHLRWDWWVIWLGENPRVRAVDGYAGWKGRLFSQIDEEMGEFIYPGAPVRIRLEEVVWGGVPKDGIPDLTNPPVVTANKAGYLNPGDRVFGVSFNGEHRAYPLRILNPHEMANDVVGGVPFALAY